MEKKNIDSRIVKEINKKIVAFLAREAGFTSITSSANEVLANVLETYFENIIKTSQEYTELARRSQININDVEKSFKEWNIRTGALDGHRNKCLKAKENYDNFVTNLKSSLLEAETIPSESSSMSLFVPEDINENDEYRPKYVPSHMPPFPAKHSYKKTPIYPKLIIRNPIKLREMKLKEVRLVEKSLYKLVQHQEEQKKIQNIPESPDTTSTVVSAVSSPHNYDLLSGSTSRKSSTTNIQLPKKRPLEPTWSEEEQ